MAWCGVVGSSESGRTLAGQLTDHGFERRPARTPAEPGVLILGEHSETDDWRAALAGGRVLVAVPAGVRVDPWALLDAGASDVLPVEDVTVDDVIARLDRWAAIDRIVESADVASFAVGASTRWRSMLREVVEAARFTDQPILLTGETGVGKDVLARLVHRLGTGDRQEMVVVDCGSVVPTLAGSEFFGHDRGAFTGAQNARMGAFEQANGGLLFLDELGELPADLQVALLRVIQEGTFKRVGGTRWQKTRFRLVSATNRDLFDEQATGGFRADLYHRLASTVIAVPPLRDRPDDVVPLFRHFVACARPGRDPVELTDAVVELLTGREFPGNVRELRQLALRVATRHVGRGPITPGAFPTLDRPPATRRIDHDVRPVPPGADPPAWRDQLVAAVSRAIGEGVGLKELKELVPEVATEVALRRAGGPTAAARLLGVSRRAVGYRTAGAARPQVDQPNEAST